MTVEGLIVGFGIPTIGLLTAIFYRLGSVNASIKEHASDISALWEAIKDLRKDVYELLQ